MTPAHPLHLDAGRYLASLGVPPRGLNTFASRRAADPDRRQVDIHADGTTFAARVRLDTSREADYYRHGGVLPCVLRTLLDLLTTRRVPVRKNGRPWGARGWRSRSASTSRRS